MKKHILFLICSVLPSVITVGQSFTWSDPVPVTDSVNDNRNINMSDIFSYPVDSIYAVWELQNNSTTSSIFCRNFATENASFPILSTPGILYTHPHVFKYFSGDTLLAVLYETNMNGNRDIYYSKYLANGTVSPPIPVCNSSADEINFSFCTNNTIAWEENGAIKVKSVDFYGSSSGNPVTIAMGDCHSPVLSSGYCEWLKIAGSDTIVMYSIYNYIGSTWSAPAQLYGGVNDNISCGDGSGSLVSWQTRENNKWRVKAASMYDQSLYFVNDFPGNNNIDPTSSSIMIVTDKGFPNEAFFFSFCSDFPGNFDVYVNLQPWDTTFMNISNYPTQNLHPQFYSVFDYVFGCQTIFLFWESWRNNHWQIWMTHLDIPIGIDDHGKNGMNLVSYPNPFTGSTNISYTVSKDSHSSVTILDLMGKKIRALKDGTDSPGPCTISWNGRDDHANRVPSGIYIIRLQNGSETTLRKVTIY